MQRKQVIVGALVVVAIAIVVALGWSSGAERRPREVARTEARPHAEGASGAGHAASAPEPRPEPGALVLADDGGVPRAPAQRAPREASRPREEIAEAAERGVRTLHQSTIEADRSAGWRLGFTRGRIALVEPRITRLRQVLADLEERGDPTAVERQRAILQRFENRLASLRQEETELEAEARRDGTLGEVEEGMQAVNVSQGGRPPPRRAP